MYRGAVQSLVPGMHWPVGSGFCGAPLLHVHSSVQCGLFSHVQSSWMVGRERIYYA